MKSRFLIATVGVLLVGLTLGSAQAQTASFRAEVPFEFVVGHYTLPPGQYIFQRLLGKAKAQDTIGILVIRSVDHRIYRAIVTSIGAETIDAQSGDSRLVFTRYESRHYLDRVMLAGDEAAHILPNVPRNAVVAKDLNSGEVISMARFH